MTDTVVAEGQVKFRDGKKWKSRWVVLRKPSPVADCLYLLVYKEKKKGKEKSSHKMRLNVTLEGICGVEPGTGYDGVSYSLSILCLSHTLVLGFNNKDTLLSWDARVCYSLGEVHRFTVKVEPGTKLESGPASLHLCNNQLVLARGVPPAVIGHWKLSALRRYGAVPNGFVFEGGTRCGYWAGVFFLSCSEGEHISFLFDCIARGITPNRAPHGLRPALLAGPVNDPVSTERRISLETSELEKRLSMLSTCSLASSTASTYSCSTSLVSSDQSSISSSSSSQSEASYGRRLPFGVEPLTRAHLLNETGANSSSLDDQLYSALMGNSSSHLSSMQLHRGLHDSGWQSSLDSGIGIATSSQSSYSGSLSSHTGSLDTASQGEGKEFGSLTSLPAPPHLPPPPPPPTPPISPSQFTHIPEHPSANSSCASRSSSCASWRHCEENQPTSLLTYQYDTPRSLLKTLSLSESSSQEDKPELHRDSRSCSNEANSQGQRMSNDAGGSRAPHHAMMLSSHSCSSEREHSVHSGWRSPPVPKLFPGGLVCGEIQALKGSHAFGTTINLSNNENTKVNAEYQREYH